MDKYWLEIAAVFAIAFLIAGAYWFLILPGAETPGQPKTPPGDGQMHMIPYVEAEVTVTSVFFDELEQEECLPNFVGHVPKGTICPEDRITFTINEIDRTQDPNNQVEVSVGDEMELSLSNSARKAKLVFSLEPSCEAGFVYENGSCVQEGCIGQECPVTNPLFEGKPTEMENDTLIYYLPSTWSDVEEQKLPGLSEGMRIRIQILDMPNYIIRHYEII